MEKRSQKLGDEVAAATNLTEMIYLNRHLSEECSKDAAMRLCLGRQLLLPSSPDSASDAVAHIRAGSYYEIDHSKLPTKAPAQLKFVRVIMVSKKSKYSVSLRYPSTYSLRAHFSQRNRRKADAKMLPSLDEQYAMVPEFAGDVLYRRIPPHELAVQRNQWSFWVMDVSSKEQEMGKNPSPIPSPSPAAITSYVNMVLKKGLCWSELISGGIVRWGRRRQVRFLGRHVEEERRSRSVKADEEEDDEEDDKEEEENVVSDEEITETDRKSCKRKLHGESFKAQTVKKLKHEIDKQITLYKPSKKREIKNSIERWSVQRYNLAEKNMLKIMKEKGATFGNPILRPVLRAEARKLIGDTGLLDHLLKHMAWKVAPGGEERFMRRHNADGAMEYWLESADLMDIRKEAGVEDPYWTPPPGWKLGDNPTQDPVCARELKELREEIAKLKKGMMETEDTNLAIVISPKSCITSQNMAHDAAVILPPKEKYEDLMILKAKLEGQLGEIAKSLSGVEEEMGKLKCKVEAANALIIMGSTTPALCTESDKSTILVISDEEKDSDPEAKTPAVTRKRRNTVAEIRTEDKAAKIERLKSGFRICKPQGTFLWPNMALSHQVDELLPIPTPPSVSSSTVKPLAERRNTTVAVKYLPTPPPPPDATTTTKTALINLNEVPGNNLHDHGYCGSHSSPCSRTYQRRHHHLPRMIQAKKEKEIEQWEGGNRQQLRGYSSSPSSPTTTWWALSTPTSSMNSSPRRT